MTILKSDSYKPITSILLFAT